MIMVKKSVSSEGRFQARFLSTGRTKDPRGENVEGRGSPCGASLVCRLVDCHFDPLSISHFPSGMSN